MNEKMLDKASLFVFLQEVIAENNNISEIHAKIIAKLTFLLHETSNINWTLDHFLALAVGFYFAERIIDPNYMEDPDSYYQGREIKIALTKKIDDVKNILSEAVLLFDQKYEVLELAVQENEICNPSSPINWLESAQKFTEITLDSCDNRKPTYERRVTIASEMTLFIRRSYYNLDFRLSEEGIFPVSRYSFSEAAKELEINQDDLTVKCLDGDFGVYLKIGRFEIKRFSGVSVTCSMIEENADFSYPYTYTGHVRLTKDSAVLKEIYQGGSIRVKKGDSYRLLLLQPSVAECVQGVSLYIQLCSGEEITLNDLVLIKSEVQQYKVNKTELVDSQGALRKQKNKNDDDNLNLKTINEEENLFSKKEAVYEIRFNGLTNSFPIKKGLRYIEYLLKNPKKTISCLELVQRFTPGICDTGSNENPVELYEQGIGQDPFSVKKNDTPLDEQAISNYRRELKDIDDEIADAEAEEIKDIAVIEKLKSDRDFILDELSANTNYKGQPRSFPDDYNRARVALVNAVKRAKEIIKNSNPDLAQHLERDLKVGGYCSYNPVGPIVWA